MEYEQGSKERTAYGKKLLGGLSKELTQEFGKGFSVSNLQFMIRFYQGYSIQQTELQTAVTESFSVLRI